MSCFKSLLGAGLLMSLLGFDRQRRKLRPNRNHRECQCSNRLAGPEQRVALVIGNSNYQ